MTPREMDKHSREVGKSMMKDDALTSLKKNTAKDRKEKLAKAVASINHKFALATYDKSKGYHK